MNTTVDGFGSAPIESFEDFPMHYRDGRRDVNIAEVAASKVGVLAESMITNIPVRVFMRRWWARFGAPILFFQGAAIYVERHRLHRLTFGVSSADVLVSSH